MRKNLHLFCIQKQVGKNLQIVSNSVIQCTFIKDNKSLLEKKSFSLGIFLKIFFSSCNGLTKKKLKI